MSPYELMIMLSAYCSEEQPYDGKNAPIYHETMKNLVNQGLFVESKTVGPGIYYRTDKLIGYVKCLCMMPIPTLQWAIPGMGILVTDTP